MHEQITGSLLTGLAREDQEDQVEEMVGCSCTGLTHDGVR